MNAWKRAPIARPVPVISRRRTTTRSTAVLLPGLLGGLQLYTRRAPGRLRTEGPLLDVQHLDDRLRQLPNPCSVILCGRRHLGQIADLVLSSTDLYVVPLDWLDAISLPHSSEPHDLDKRALLAARLASAHRRAPIERFCARQLPLPF